MHNDVSPVVPIAGATGLLSVREKKSTFSSALLLLDLDSNREPNG